MTVRVLVVDDSPTSRLLLTEILDADPGIQVVGQAADGASALCLVMELRPSLVLMDVRMRGMDGFETTERIMAAHPTPIVAITAGHDARDVELGMRALRAGALTLLAKPPGPGSPHFRAEASQLCALVGALADVRVVRRRGRSATTGAQPVPTPARPGAPQAPGPGMPGLAAPVRDPGVPIRAVGVAVSTGGPVALHRFLTELPTDLAVPVLAVQHIARGFVEGLAGWLAAQTGRDIRVAVDGQIACPGAVYLAPDDRHLEAAPGGVLRVTDGPPMRGFRPSGTVLLQSLARVHRRAAAAVVLTGMGNDGLEGARAVADAGGLVLAQDEASAAVYGMPKAVIDAGLACRVGSPEVLANVLAPLTRVTQ